MIGTTGPGQRRSSASREAILSATFALLEELDFDQLSIEGIAARAGVGKTTIYRWWTSKGTLAVDAFLNAVTPAIAFPSTGSAWADIRKQMRLLAKLYRSPSGRLVRQMIGAAQADPAMHSAFVEGFLTPRRQAARQVLLRGIQTGEFSPDCDLDLTLDALYGPIYYRLLVSGAPFDDAFLDAIAEVTLPSILRRG